MNNLRLILLLQALMLGATTLNAEDCPCDGGTADYSVDCDGDGTNDACSADDCEPCEAGNPASTGMECCGNEEFDPTPTSFTPQQWNIQQIMDMYNTAKSALTAIGPCNDSGGGAPSVGVQVAFFKECCDDDIVDLEKYTGSVTWDLGSTTCDWPILGIPYTASVNVTANAGFNVSINASGEQTCDETDICFTGNASFSLGGGVSATAAAGVIRVSATLQAANTADVGYCTVSGVTGNVCVSSLDVVGTAELAFISKSISYNLYSGGC